MTPTRTPADILHDIRQHDRTQWSTPSNRLACHIHALEEEYTRATGRPCPAWPKREATSASEANP
jgi:hypothetical protein